MWLLPRSCNITVFWSVVKDSPYFQLLKYKGGLLMGVISTVRSLNPLDSNPQPFRYVLIPVMPRISFNQRQNAANIESLVSAELFSRLEPRTYSLPWQTPSMT